MKKKTRVILTIIILILVVVFGISALIALSEAGSIKIHYEGDKLTEEEYDMTPDCILVLGCAAVNEDTPSPMLKDRLDAGIDLYKRGAAPKLLLSGDNSTVEYSEPACMYKYAIEHGVPDEDIFLDYAGFSTYESAYRAKYVFLVKKAIVVSQTYHLFRALKDCDSIGIEAVGAAADQRKYRGRFAREAREVLARDKDLIKDIFKPESKFLGEEIPIESDGRKSRDGSEND